MIRNSNLLDEAEFASLNVMLGGHAISWMTNMNVLLIEQETWEELFGPMMVEIKKTDKPYNAMNYGEWGMGNTV